jgi:predicted RNase H-like nuclease
MQLIGIDGCADGWLAAVSDERLDAVDFTVLARLDELFARARDGEALVVIDIPIGLSDHGARGCDVAARRFLGAPRNSSVFPAPCRAALDGSTYPEACTLNRQASGKSMSKQAFAILPKIREVDDLMTPALQRSVREGHPEVTFAALAATGRGLAFPKKSRANDRQGEEERMQLLERVLRRFDPGHARARLRPARVQRDDFVDAAALLVTAYRVSQNMHIRLPPGEPEVDAAGLRMEMVA